MSTKTIMLLMATVVGVCVTVAWALYQQIYTTIAGLRGDVREILRILLQK